MIRREEKTKKRREESDGKMKTELCRYWETGGECRFGQ